MIPYLPCETARALLEPLVDRELSTTDQVAVEAHLRVCGTCRARVEDLFLIGWSLRTGTPTTAPADADSRALGVVQSGVLERIRAERAQSWRAWLPEMLTDMRLWWPAMGATAAVLLCFWSSVWVWQLTLQRHSDSLAAKLDRGSDTNPVPSDDDGISVPVSLGHNVTLESVSAADGTFLLTFVVTQKGLVTTAELVGTRNAMLPAASAGQMMGEALLQAVRGLRYTPAQAPDGRAVAVRLVMLVERTTITETWRPIEQNPPIRRRSIAPKTAPAPTPQGVRSGLQHGSARA